MAKKAAPKKTPKKKAPKSKKTSTKTTKVKTIKEHKTIKQQVTEDLQALKASGKEGINLDLYGRDWLMAFWDLARNQQSWIRQILFPERVQNSNELRDAIDDLCAYAVARTCVIDCLEGRKDESAVIYEQHCKIYHSNLPMWARFK